MQVRFFIVFLILSAFVFGCKSTQDAAQTPLNAAQTTPPAATDILSQVQSARDAAVDAKADVNCPEALASVDALFDAAKEERDGAGKTAKLNDLLLRYKALETLSVAAHKKTRVDGLDFPQYDNASYTKAEAAMAVLTAADFEKDNAQTLLDTAATASDSYGTVLFAGFTAIAGQARKDALASKSRADSIKADVAAKDAYAVAGSYFKTGDEDMENKVPEAALADFQIARLSYEEIYIDVLARRNAAQIAIQRAEQRAQEVEDFAAEADLIAPQAEGDAE